MECTRNEPPAPWEVLETRVLLERWWMRLRVDHVRLPSGVELEEFHVIEYPDWACVLALTEAGQVLTVRQYRHGIGRLSLELPAGAVDAGETPLQAARRELLEETGYEAPQWHYLGSCAPEPSKHTNLAHGFVALGARKVQEVAHDHSEDMDLCRMSPEELLHRALHGEILHGIHLTVIFWAALKGFLQAR